MNRQTSFITQKYKLSKKIHSVCICHFVGDIISCIGCRLLNIRKCHCKMNLVVVISISII